MALIKCPECKSKISDKAKTCPQCGYPLKEELSWNIVLFNGQKVDATEPLLLMKEFGVDHIDPELKALKLSLKYGFKKDEMRPFVEATQKHFLEIQHQIPSDLKASIPRCPHCGSGDIQKHGLAARAIDGFIFGGLSVEGRAQYICKKCKHMW